MVDEAYTGFGRAPLEWEQVDEWLPYDVALCRTHHQVARSEHEPGMGYDWDPYQPSTWELHQNVRSPLALPRRGAEYYPQYDRVKSVLYSNSPCIANSRYHHYHPSPSALDPMYRPSQRLPTPQDSIPRLTGGVPQRSKLLQEILSLHRRLSKSPQNSDDAQGEQVEHPGNCTTNRKGHETEGGTLEPPVCIGGSSYSTTSTSIHDAAALGGDTVAVSKNDRVEEGPPGRYEQGDSSTRTGPATQGCSALPSRHSHQNDASLLTQIQMPDGTYKTITADRAAKLYRHRQKRLARLNSQSSLQKRVRYECRQVLAAARPRVQGRFARVVDKEAGPEDDEIEISVQHPDH